MKLRDISVGRRLGAGFTFLLLFVLFLAIASLVQGARYRSDLYTAMATVNLRGNLAASLRYDAAQLRDSMARALREGFTPETVAEITRENSALRVATDSLSKLPDSDRKTFSAAAESLAMLSSLAIDMTQSASGQDAKIDGWREQMRQLDEQQLPILDACLNTQLQVQSALPTQSEEGYRAKAVGTVGTVIALIVLFGASIAWALTRSVTAPLKQAVAIAGQIAGGNLDIQIEVTGRDELSQMLTAVKEMHEALTSVIFRVRAASSNISQVSLDITQGSIDLSTRTETQAASLEETAASMEQLSSTVANNADNVQHANRLAVDASRIAADGGDIVARMVATMEDIRRASDRIRNIVGVIDGIAFQTNILALNASVEAARVGERGQGFAVVASEVRNLARRAADAAKDIRNLIDDSMTYIEAGCEFAGQAGAAMQKVVTSITNVNHVVTEINGANREQASGLDQINKAVIELDEVAQRNAEQGQHAASNADALMQEVAVLAEAVNAFRLEQSNNSIVFPPHERLQYRLTVA